MPQINCYIPIKLRLVGELSSTNLDQLEEAIVRAITERMASAERTLRSRHADLADGGDREAIREIYDPARDDTIRQTYAVPSYQGSGAPTGVPVRGQARGRRLWLVQTSITFRVRVEQFIEYLGSLESGSQAFVAESKLRFHDLLSTVRNATAWLVVAQTPLSVKPLIELVKLRYENFVPAKLDYVYGYTVFEAPRRRLLELEEGNKLAKLPDMTRNPGGTAYGQTYLNPGGMVLFVAMPVPKVELRETAVLGREIEVTLHVRDLDFIVNGDSFRRLFGVPWSNYLQEFGTDSAVLRIQTVTPLVRVHFDTLKYLVDQSIAGRVDERSAYFGNLYLLNQTRLDWLPAVARASVRPVVDDMTFALDDAKRLDHWEPGWAGGFIYAVLSPTADQLSVARWRPAARQLLPLLLAKLAGDPTGYGWARELFHFLRDNVDSDPPRTRPEGGTVWEFVLAELERRGEFDLLFDKVDRADYTALHQHVIRLALATRYATHARVQSSAQLLNRRVLGRRENIYQTAKQEVWLDRDGRKSVRAGGVFGESDSIYFFERDAKRLKPARLVALRAALDVERQALIGRILRGEDTKRYTEDEFARTALGAAAQRINLSKDDFEEITIQRSMRLLRVEERIEKALTRIYITFEFVERVVGEAWQSTSGPYTEIEDNFEARLIYWKLGRAEEFWSAAGKVVTVVGLVAFAWEAGIIALLVEAAGGAMTVLVSITISELIYVLRVTFGDAKLSLRGFLEAALDGYLMALGFRGASFLGKTAALAIGKETFTEIIGGWAAKVLITGTVGGAGTAALTTFSHDLINVATGTGGWSGIGTYVRNMGWGALLGTVFEFGAAALQPLLRVGAGSALETIADVVGRVRAEGFSAVRWTALTAEALGNLRARLSVLMGDVAAQGFVRAMGERLAQVAEQLGAEYRLAVFRRVLELSPEALTGPSVEGLEKFLGASRANLTNEAALSILNRLNSAELRSFLESLNRLDSSVVGALSRSRQLEALASAPRTLDVIGSDPVLADMVARTASLAPDAAAARVQALAGVAGRLPTVPEAVRTGDFFARGGTSSVYEVAGRPDLLAKLGGGRLPVEARGLIELETMGIETVYAGTRQVEGASGIVLRRVDGVSSKDIIGRTRRPLSPPEHVDIITQRTIDDLERIYQTLERNKANVGDFQFIVRRADGAVFVNDPVSVTIGSGPSGSLRNIIDRFRAIRRRAGGTP